MELILGSFIKNADWWWSAGIGALVAFLLTWFAIPAVVRISKHLNLFERNSSRGSHEGSIPTLGGVAIFGGIVVSGSIFLPAEIMPQYRIIIASMVLLFFVGVRDDLKSVKSKRKLLFQLIVALMITILGDVRITNFQGFLGIWEMSYIVSILFSVFVYVLIINGFNLIDGIDGLASGVAIVASITFAILFAVNREHIYSIEPIIITGSLLAFFIYNVFSRKNKIFLGDTGSLTIGFLIAVVTVYFIEIDRAEGHLHYIISVPAMTFAILVVPLFDTLRIFVIRAIRGQSPFAADRKHIHHRLLDLGCSHLKSTVIILSANLLIIGVALLLRDLKGYQIVLITLLISAGLSYIPVYLVERGK